MKSTPIFLFLLTVVIAGAHTLVSAQTSLRVINWPSNDSIGNSIKDQNGVTAPTELKAIEILSIKVEGQTVYPRSPFSASDDWLKSLTVRIKNISDKPIRSIRIHFGLPEAKFKEGISNYKNAFCGFSLEYGRELSTGIDYGDQKLISPGEEIDIVRNERHYERDSEGIRRRCGAENIQLAFFGVTMLVFEDGMVWSSQKLPFKNGDVH